MQFNIINIVYLIVLLSENFIRPLLVRIWTYCTIDNILNKQFQFHMIKSDISI